MCRSIPLVHVCGIILDHNHGFLYHRLNVWMGRHKEQVWKLVQVVNCESLSSRPRLQTLLVEKVITVLNLHTHSLRLISADWAERAGLARLNH